VVEAGCSGGEVILMTVSGWLICERPEVGRPSGIKESCIHKTRCLGKKLEILKEDGEWVIYHLGKGKKSRSNDLLIPSEFNEAEVILYLEDMLHEVATPANPKIKRLD
jgi:hypothetical protein